MKQADPEAEAAIMTALLACAKFLRARGWKTAGIVKELVNADVNEALAKEQKR